MGELGQYVDGGIDPNETEPMDFEPLPPGWYQVEIEDAEVKDTKKGDGKYLKITHCIIGDEYNGRKLFDNITIVNPSEKATSIGRSQLAGLAVACGIALLDDEDKLLGKTLMAKVKVETSAQYGDSNKIMSYKPDGAVQQQPQEQSIATSQQPDVAQETPPKEHQPEKTKSTGKMPWER